MLKFQIIQDDYGKKMLATASTKTEEWRSVQKVGSTVYLKQVKDSELRTLSQNRLMWKWYAEIGKFMGHTQTEIHAMMKLKFGVPILIRDSEKFATTWETLGAMSYGMKLDLIEHIDVTSTFKKSQANEYMDAVQQFGSEAGVVLTDPSLRGFE